MSWDPKVLDRGSQADKFTHNCHNLKAKKLNKKLTLADEK